jgi:GTP cyclohydrolase III
MMPAERIVVEAIVFFIGNKNLSEVKDKEEKQDISEISDQIQKNSN